MLLITGASGHLGSRIHTRLTEKGVDALAGTRTPGRFGARGRAMDFDDEASLDLSGVHTLLLVSAGYAEDDVVIARHGRVIAAAEREGVRHIIYTSVMGAGDHLGFALAHRWTERRLREGTASWTILRNGLYAELFGSLAAPVHGAIRAPFGDGAVAAVARDDLAEAAATVAADPAAHRDRVYELGGSTELTARGLAGALGVPYQPMSLSETRAALAGAALLPFQPPMLMSVFSATAAGFLGRAPTDLDRLLPHPPRDIAPIAVAAARGAG